MSGRGLTMDVSDDAYTSLAASLLNTKGSVPLHERFRALFTLKSLKTPRAIEIISEGLKDESALLKHELAYCLGQIGDERALPVLQNVLGNMKEDPMVRHEAAEAMGAISSVASIPVLRKYLEDSNRSVRETCEIALARIEWDQTEEGQQHRTKQQSEIPTYTSVDPAPPTPDLLSGLKDFKPSLSKDISNLESTLLDTTKPLFERYRAMFGLRNIGTKEAVDALAAGFNDDSALFKHEIAFVFGQLLSPHSVPALIRVLQNSNESEMVRHEAAEALGGIATPECLPHLQEWAKREDAPRVVRESCIVALDMWEYENSDQFQYADGLQSTMKEVAPTPAPAVTASA